MTVISMPVRTGNKPSDVNIAVLFGRADGAFEQAAGTVAAMLSDLTEDQLVLVEHRARERYGYGPTGSYFCNLIDEEFCRRRGVNLPEGTA